MNQNHFIQILVSTDHYEETSFICELNHISLILNENKTHIFWNEFEKSDHSAVVRFFR